MRRTLIALSLASTLAAAPTSFFGELRSFLSSLWSDTGCMIDPNGRCLTERTDTGCHIDPNGRCGS